MKRFVSRLYEYFEAFDERGEASRMDLLTVARNNEPNLNRALDAMINVGGWIEEMPGKRYRKTPKGERFHKSLKEYGDLEELIELLHGFRLPPVKRRFFD